jgi:hypothetical protein
MLSINNPLDVADFELVRRCAPVMIGTTAAA